MTKSILKKSNEKKTTRNTEDIPDLHKGTAKRGDKGAKDIRDFYTAADNGKYSQKFRSYNDALHRNSNINIPQYSLSQLKDGIVFNEVDKWKGNCFTNLLTKIAYNNYSAPGKYLKNTKAKDPKLKSVKDTLNKRGIEPALTI